MFDAEQSAHIALRSIVSERTRPLVAWVGSGLSASAGLPTWAALKTTLVEVAQKKVATLSDVAEIKARSADLNQIASSTDYWLAFQRLETILGSTSFTAAVREALALAPTAQVPEAYKKVWALPIRGVLTLNIDRLATRAHQHSTSEVLPLEASGPQIARLQAGMFGQQRFIGNLHGVVEDSSTWVFTRERLAALQRDEAYRAFMHACLSQFTNIFIGINPDDRAIALHLESIQRLGIQGATGFWFTDRRDASTDTWAESQNIRAIRYTSRGSDHSELLDALEDLATFEAVEENAAPVSPPERTTATNATSVLENPEGASSAVLRQALNAEAARILAPETDEAYQEYSDFCDLHDELIYRAWYTSTREGANDLLGFTLRREVARGAFGRVYEASDPAGDNVAVKVLLDEVRRDPTLRESFRRGVRSMRILRDAGLDGVVQYRAASEIPAFVAMEWVEGDNLEEVKRSRCLEEWSQILRVAGRVLEIIRAAHSLPERVLHRDLRPPNVMLRDFWTNRDEFEVVVLDFDLSWHRGAAEKSVVFTSASGYLAPEQLSRREGQSTRNAAVDSFGIGMLLYYLATGNDPSPNQHVRSNWTDVAMEGARTPVGGDGWQSIHKRFARAIVGATRDNQSERWDLARIAREIEAVSTALESGSTTLADLAAEELAASCSFTSKYDWNDDLLAASYRSPTGVSVTLQGDHVERTVKLRLEWIRTGSEERSGLTKYILEKRQLLESKLRRDWSHLTASSAGDSLVISCDISLDVLSSKFRSVAERLDETLDTLRFDRPGRQ